MQTDRTNARTNARTTGRTNAQIGTSAQMHTPSPPFRGGSVHAVQPAQVQAGLFDEPAKPDLGQWAVEYLNDALRFADPADRRDRRLPDALTAEELQAIANATPPDLIRTTMALMLEETGR